MTYTSENVANNGAVVLAESNEAKSRLGAAISVIEGVLRSNIGRNSVGLAVLETLITLGTLGGGMTGHTHSYMTGCAIGR